MSGPKVPTFFASHLISKSLIKLRKKSAKVYFYHKFTFVFKKSISGVKILLFKKGQPTEPEPYRIASAPQNVAKTCFEAPKKKGAMVFKYM